MKLLVVLLCIVSASLADDQWCKKEHLHPFESALEYLGEAEKISPSGLQTLINELFYRVSCDKMNLGNFTCETVSVNDRNIYTEFTCYCVYGIKDGVDLRWDI